MSNIQDIVDSLENRISKMLHKLEVLKQSNVKLNQELSVSEQKIAEQEKELLNWEERYESLKVASSMLGSEENKRETKLKINALVREIDHCIVQLSE
jgi:transcriptional antiterminator